MMKWIGLLILVISPKVFACQNLQMQLATTVINMSTSSSTTSSVTVKGNSLASGCTFFVTVDYGASSTYSSRALRMGGNLWPYQITKDSAGLQPLKKFPDVSSNNDVLTGSMATGQGNDVQINIPFWVFLDQTDTWRTFGSYSDTMTFTLYTGTIASPTQVTSTSLSINYQSQKHTDIAIENTGGTFQIGDTTKTMNFGGLTSGAVQTCDVIVKTNAGYILLVGSQNNGQLKHTTQNKFVSYTAKFNGNSVNLSNSASSPVQIARVNGSSPASGFVIPASITIGTIPANQQGGTYQDSVTLTVQSAD